MNTPTVIELRQYTLHPGRRDELIALFEREFIASQAAAGLQVLATFTEPAAPERFVWLRGFADMAERRRGLAAFYGGPVWQAHRDAANATMIDSDDVLLLRPITTWPAQADAGVWHGLVCELSGAADGPLRDALRQSPGTWLESEPSENDFPRLPVRSGHWVVCLAPQPPWLSPPLRQRLAAPPQRLHLTPTRLSLWH